jgi:hypothetical protein
VDSLSEVLQSVLIKGDLSKLTPQERVNYLVTICKSIGLNPLTQPFEFIWLGGKLVLYAKKDCTDQLRRIHKVSIKKVDQHVKDGLLTMTAQARLPDGREDEDIGCVSFPDTLKGDIRANTAMKCWTKAKRRSTLSICGLGFLDETEVETIPDARVEPTPRAVEETPKPDASGDFPGDKPDDGTRPHGRRP